METKSISTEIKSVADGGFEGYASVFGVRDSYDDIVMAGAYAKTIQERTGKIKSLWNHDAYSLPIGKFTAMHEDQHGLYVVAEFSKTSLAQDIRTLIAEGALDSMSVGYQTVKADYGLENGIEVRYLRELRLLEVSVVSFPANPDAIITGSKSVSHIERLITQLDNAVSVGIKSGRPLSAENLARLQTAYKSLQALLSDGTEPPSGTQADQGAATADAEPPTHSDDLLPALKSFTPFPQNRDEAAVLAELKSAFAFIHQGA